MSKLLENVTSARLIAFAFVITACQSESTALFDDYQPAAGSANDGGTPAAGSAAGGGSGEGDAAGTNAVQGGTGGLAPGGEGGEVAESGAPATGGTASSGGMAGSGGVPGVAGAGAGGGGAAPLGGTGGGAGAQATGGTGTVTYGDPITVESAIVSDTFVISCYPMANYAADATLVIDKEPCQAEIFLKPSIEQIPSNALIQKATISLTCTNPGAGLAVYRPESDWSADTLTWATRPSGAVVLGDIGAIGAGSFVIDATVLVQAWVDGSRAPHGLELRTEQSDGLIFASSRAADANQRPKFSVTYVVPKK